MKSYDTAARVEALRFVRAAALAGAALTVSGCVNMGQLNNEVLADAKGANASVPTVDCGGDATPPGPKAMLARISANSASLRAFTAIPDMTGMSDMEAGRAIIEGAGGSRAGLSRAASAAVPAGQMINSALNWRLEALTEDMPRVNEAAG